MTESTIEMLEQSDEERQRRGMFAATRATEVARAYGYVAGTLLPDLLAAGALRLIPRKRASLGRRQGNVCTTREFWDKIVSDLATRVASVQNAATRSPIPSAARPSRMRRHSALLERLDQILTLRKLSARPTWCRG